MRKTKKKQVIPNCTYCGEESSQRVEDFATGLSAHLCTSNRCVCRWRHSVRVCLKAAREAFQISCEESAIK